MTRAALQRVIWLALKDLGADRHPLARNVIDNVLDAADSYASNRENHAALARLTASWRDYPERQAERRAVIEELVYGRRSA